MSLWLYEAQRMAANFAKLPALLCRSSPDERMRHVRDEGVAGSNPAAPTNFLQLSIATGPDVGNETHFRDL